MFWASALVLFTVTSAVSPAAATPARAPVAATAHAVAPQRVASTYDDAACATDADEAGAPADLLAVEERDCEQPEPAPTPTIIDCNDPGASFWVTEMIGSCDMPRTSPGAGPPASVRAGRDNFTNRLCEGIRCLPDSSPLRPAGRLLDDGTPALAEVLRLGHDFKSTPLFAAPLLCPNQADERRLERPPRAI